MKPTISPKTLALVVAIFAWACAGHLPGLDPKLDIHQYNSNVYLTEDGLPQSSVLTIVQTEDGYLWLGTYEGLARFDGVRFELFNKSNIPQMASNRVKTLLEDDKGRLWIGTSKGLLCYFGGTFTNYTTTDGLSSDFITILYEDREGHIWAGTTHGLNRLEKNGFTSYTRQQGLTRNYITSLAEDEEGRLWIGVSGGGLNLLSLSSGEITHCPIEGLPDEVDIRVLHKDAGGSIWIGTGGKGLAVAKGRKFRLYSTRDGLSGNDIRAIFRDSHGTLWVGTNGKGLNAFKDGTFSFSVSEQGLFDSPIRTILEDRESNLWVGTRDGLSQLRDGKFIIYNRGTGLPVDSVRTVFQDSAGDVWLGTVGGGLVRCKAGRFKTFGIKEGLKSEHIWTIAEGKDRSIWFGTYGGGLHQLKNGKISRVYTTANGLSNNVVRAVWVDRRGHIWVGTNGGGVDVLRDGRLINFNTTKGLSDNFVYAVSEDKNGDIWVGTYQGNINRIRNGKITAYGAEAGLTGHSIWAIYPDEEGTIWVGTDGGGLLCFKDNRFTRFTMKDGLYSDLAFEVFEDLRQNLWMNCNRGIYRVRKKALEDFALGRIKKIPCLSFGKSEGIKNTESSGPAQPAGLCTREGTLWFPTIRGAVVIDPGNIKVNRVAPPVAVEEMEANGKIVYTYPAHGGDTLELPPGTKRVEFRYTGLSFSFSPRVKFKYKLEGFDEEWLEAETRRSVSYTNIPPGKYTFKVTAGNNDGVWNREGTELSFILHPFFWQTWWFRVLFVLVFAFLSYLVIGFFRKHLTLITFWERKKHIASYEIEERIGVGGMGLVYRVHSLIDKTRTFAVKVMKEEYSLDELQKKRFKNESLLVDRLDHPHIVRIYERGEDNGRLYIVMELLEGQTLADRFKENKYPDVGQCIHIMTQVADILVNLHRENIIHRDLKPENIMLITRNDDPDFVKLLDFGIARVQSFSHLTESGQILGTLHYMPPEVLSDGMVSRSLDVYSLGVIGYEMATRQKPFTGENPVDIMKKVIDHVPAEPVRLNPKIPAPLNHLVVKMMEKNPPKRPNAVEVLDFLQNLES